MNDTELQAAREANPESLVFRVNRWNGIDQEPTTAILAVPPGKKPGRPPVYSAILGAIAIFGVDEIDINRPAAT